MNWKIGLDRYLTSGPSDDGFEDYCEHLLENGFSEQFYKENEAWLFDSTQLDKWSSKLFNKGFEPLHAAKIIERAFNIYIKK